MVVVVKGRWGSFFLDKFRLFLREYHYPFREGVSHYRPVVPFTPNGKGMKRRNGDPSIHKISILLTLRDYQEKRPDNPIVSTNGILCVCTEMRISVLRYT